MTIFVENNDGKTIPIDDTRAVYRVLNVAGFFGPNDHLYNEGSIIYYDGEPNEELEPLTPVAYDRMTTFIDKLEEEGRKVAEKLGRAYTGRPRSLDGALNMATAVQRAEMSIFGAKKNDTTVESAEPQRTPEVGTHEPKRSRGRPRKGETDNIRAA